MKTAKPEVASALWILVAGTRGAKRRVRVVIFVWMDENPSAKMMESALLFGEKDGRCETCRESTA